MSRLPEITDIFSTLALHIQTLSPTVSDEDSVANSISNLNRSLNLNDDASRVRVLDTALSLMCFRAPQVFDSAAEYLVRTIISLLSSSVDCKVLMIRKQEVLRIGSSFSRADCFKLIEAWGHMLGRLQGPGNCSSNLLYAVVRAAVSAGSFRYSLPFVPVLDVKSYDMRPDVSRLCERLPEGFFLDDQGISLRLLLWYLDPLILKRDVIKIIHDVKERPFLFLSEEFRQRRGWHSIMTCLVLSPTMFIETTALLHSWFLATGLTSVLQLQIQLVALILDVLSRPTWWGISMDMGLKLPFLHAYFPNNYHLLEIFSGPLSCEAFIQLVDFIDKPVNHSDRHLDPVFKQRAVSVATVGHTSMWAMAVAFPDWFLFASVLLFYDKTSQQNFHPQCTLWIAITNQLAVPGSTLITAAARYISWILGPQKETHWDMVDSLIKISGSWTNRFCNSLNKDAEGHRKKLKRPKVHEKENTNLSKEDVFQKIGLWLEELRDVFNRSTGFCFRQSVLFRRIPLGILLLCSNYLNEDGFEVLLNFAATGTIISASGSTSAGKHFKNSNDTHRNEAIAGACIVFSLIDTVEILSDSLFETEEHVDNFISLVKRRSSKYLLRCIKTLLQLKPNGDGAIVMLTDLCSRLARWRNQGLGSILDGKDLDDVISALDQTISSL
ncbi:hypothetical protein Ancab_027327 [Ancistrocladus abbreviatus]